MIKAHFFLSSYLKLFGRSKCCYFALNSNIFLPCVHCPFLDEKPCAQLHAPNIHAVLADVQLLSELHSPETKIITVKEVKSQKQSHNWIWKRVTW